MRDKLLDSREVGGKKVNLYDTGRARELYIDGLQGVFISDHAVKLNLFSVGFSHDVDIAKEEYRELSARIVCSHETFLAIADVFSKVANDIKALQERQKKEQAAVSSDG